MTLPLVTVRVRNAGDANGTYAYDIDSCDPAFAPPADQVCTLFACTLDVTVE